MKKLLLLLFLFLSVPLQAQQLEGSWSWISDNGANQFQLSLEENNAGIIRGNHCAVFFNGDKIDCSQEDGSFSLALMRIADGVYAGTIHSAYSFAEGKIRLVYNKKFDRLTFTLTTDPPGEYYLPQIAILERSSTYGQ
ncbi:MAG: hypothetical protein WCE57_02990 [Salegentibacter sp.]